MRLLKLMPILPLALAACVSSPPERPVGISFGLMAADKPVACGEAILGLGTAGSSAKLSDARFYVHDVELIGRDGKRVPVTLSRNDWQYGGVALLDFENGTGACRGTPGTNTKLTGLVPEGDYRGLAFVIGVPVTGHDEGKAVRLNHSNPTATPAPLDLVAMGWTWLAGRKFVKIELDPEKGVSKQSGRPAPTWNFHLGSTGCSGDPVKGEAIACTNPNRIPVVLSNFNSDTQQVVLDLKQLFANTDIEKDGGMALGCMSGVDDPDCPGIFGQIGLNMKETPSGAGNAGRINGDGTNSRIFRAETKR
ncbi:MAG: metallo-mystery pair system four-Cys motif protein [Rhodospirillales bacterium]|nr:MAG: metallo-mystery pair system four-Cys motif protein [Rhodospirillales bacterium]